MSHVSIEERKIHGNRYHWIDVLYLVEENTKIKFQSDQRYVSTFIDRWIISEIFLELRQAFDLFDADHSGGISVSELKQALSALGVPVTDQEARQMFSAIDADSNSLRLFSLLIDIRAFFSSSFL